MEEVTGCDHTHTPLQMGSQQEWKEGILCVFSLAWPGLVRPHPTLLATPFTPWPCPAVSRQRASSRMPCPHGLLACPSSETTCRTSCNATASHRGHTESHCYCVLQGTPNQSESLRSNTMSLIWFLLPPTPDKLTSYISCYGIPEAPHRSALLLCPAGD